MKRAIIVIGLMTLGLTAAIAQSNVVEQRQDLMKQFGAQSKTIAGMLRGQTPFDLAQAQAALKTVSETAKKLPPLFPESTKTAAKTEALPTVWENKAEFERQKKLSANRRPLRDNDLANRKVLLFERGLGGTPPTPGQQTSPSPSPSGNAQR